MITQLHREAAVAFVYCLLAAILAITAIVSQNWVVGIGCVVCILFASLIIQTGTNSNV